MTYACHIVSAGARFGFKSKGRQKIHINAAGMELLPWKGHSIRAYNNA